MLLPITVCSAACDGLAERGEPDELGEGIAREGLAGEGSGESGGQFQLGTWPPSGGTLNTAHLGDSPLMRLLLPGYPHQHLSDDAFIEQVEVMVGGQYQPAATIEAEQGELVAVVDEVARRGSELVGSRWWLTPDGSEFVTITDYAEQEGRFGYQFEYEREGELVPDPEVCPPDEDGDGWTYMVGDVRVDVGDGSITDDPGALLVACASGALGKAISWGFVPWHQGRSRDLDLYQTGVRTVRADYCGDGLSFTEDGTLIQVSNIPAGQSFVAPEQSTEAVFGPDGAICLSNPRVEGLSPLCKIPECDASIDPLSALGVLTWTKLAPS
ncbi:MAG: ADYC domain-containing protein [Myxococcota bacterium]